MRVSPPKKLSIEQVEAVWAGVEAELPLGWRITGLVWRDPEVYLDDPWLARAEKKSTRAVMFGVGPTPDMALRCLALVVTGFDSDPERKTQ